MAKSLKTFGENIWILRILEHQRAENMDLAWMVWNKQNMADPAEKRATFANSHFSQRRQVPSYWDVACHVDSSNKPALLADQNPQEVWVSWEFHSLLQVRCSQPNSSSPRILAWPVQTSALSSSWVTMESTFSPSKLWRFVFLPCLDEGHPGNLMMFQEVCRRHWCIHSSSFVSCKNNCFTICTGFALILSDREGDGETNVMHTKALKKLDALGLKCWDKDIQTIQETNSIIPPVLLTWICFKIPDKHGNKHPQQVFSNNY